VTELCPEYPNLPQRSVIYKCDFIAIDGEAHMQASCENNYEVAGLKQPIGISDDGDSGQVFHQLQSEV